MYLPDHSHCKYCGDPTAYGVDYCNDECKAKHAAEVKAEKVKDYKFYGAIVLSLAVVCIIGIAIRFFT